MDLHPCCRNLDKKLLINDTVLDLRARVSSRCVWCKKRKISDGMRDVPRWSYVSAGRNKYHLHVYCMTEMVYEACMKHGGIMGLEKVETRELVRFRGSSIGSSSAFKMMKSLLNVVLFALLGDPTILISNVFVELVWRGLK